MIYLDYSATTPPFEDTLDTVSKVSRRFFANPSSIHRLGGEAERFLQECRRQTAALLSVEAEGIIFTSGGSEGNNLAIKGIAGRFRSRGNHIITTQVEHPSVLNCCRQLEKSGFQITYLPVNNEGQLSILDLQKAMTPETILVSIIHVNNETGVVQPIGEIGKVLANYPKVFFHVDHVQGIGKVPLNIKKWGIDLCSVSGHKFHGPRGTGILYCRHGIDLAPLINGGGQEDGKRSGTENVAGIAGMVRALKNIFEQENSNREKLKNKMIKLRECMKSLKEVAIHTPETHSAPHILNISVHNIKAEVLIHALEEEEIYISTKSACASKHAEPSSVLIAMGVPEQEALEAVRISFGHLTTDNDIDTFCKIFKEKLKQLKKVMR